MSVRREELREVIKANPLLAILRNVPDEILVDYVGAILDGGVRFLEVALNSKNALGQIRKLRETYGGELLIGAGTAITVDLAKAAVEAGADFLLAPSTNEKVLCWCQENGVAILPGALTPTEVTLCMEYGCYDIKLFPAGDMPMSYVKSLKGPLDGTEYVAIGGVNRQNIGEFIRKGYIGVGLGSSILPKDAVAAGDWAAASAYVKELLTEINRARGVIA